MNEESILWMRKVIYEEIFYEEYKLALYIQRIKIMLKKVIDSYCNSFLDILAWTSFPYQNISIYHVCITISQSIYTLYVKITISIFPLKPIWLSIHPNRFVRLSSSSQTLYCTRFVSAAVGCAGMVLLGSVSVRTGRRQRSDTRSRSGYSPSHNCQILRGNLILTLTVRKQ